MDVIELRGPDACLAFLIEKQREWLPSMKLRATQPDGGRMVGIILVGVVGNVSECGGT